MAQEKDLVLIYFEDEPFSYARIEDISPDAKPGWYHVKLFMLQIPVNVVSWILRDVYIDGEPFTMGGKSMRLELVECPEVDTEDEFFDDDLEDEAEFETESGDAQIISFSDFKK